MTLDDLFETVKQRAANNPEESWTAKLMTKGPEKCAEKFGEEAVEAIIEAAKGNKTGLIKESADVIFHLFVLLRSHDITLSEVLDELTSRQVQSGLVEKAARSLKK